MVVLTAAKRALPMAALTVAPKVARMADPKADLLDGNSVVQMVGNLAEMTAAQKACLRAGQMVARLAECWADSTGNEMVAHLAVQTVAKMADK